MNKGLSLNEKLDLIQRIYDEMELQRLNMKENLKFAADADKLGEELNLISREIAKI